MFDMMVLGQFLSDFVRVKSNMSPRLSTSTCPWEIFDRTTLLCLILPLKLIRESFLIQVIHQYLWSEFSPQEFACTIRNPRKNKEYTHENHLTYFQNNITQIRIISNAILANYKKIKLKTARTT